MLHSAPHESRYLQGPCAWRGAEIGTNSRWVKAFPDSVLQQIDVAVEKTAALAWRNINRENFPLPDAGAFFDDIRDELENGTGMVQLRGLDVRRYDQEQLRRLWFGFGCHLGTPMYQNCRGEVMRDIRDEASVGQDRMLMRLWLSVPNSRALPASHAVLWGDVGAGKPRGGIAQPAVASGGSRATPFGSSGNQVHRHAPLRTPYPQ